MQSVTNLGNKGNVVEFGEFPYPGDKREKGGKPAIELSGFFKSQRQTCPSPKSANWIKPAVQPHGRGKHHRSGGIGVCQILLVFP
jgi:hypothetical protein